MAEVLIEAGADLDIKSDELETALHLAAKRNAYEIGFILIKYGSNVSISNYLGITPLMI